MNKLIALKFVFILFLAFLIKGIFVQQAFASHILFQDDFNDGDISDWVVKRNPCRYNGQPAQWKVVNERIGIKINGGSCVTEIVPSSFILEDNQEYIYEVDMEFTNTISADRNLLFRYTNQNNWYDLKFYDFTMQYQKLVSPYYRLESTNYLFQSGQTYHFRIEVLENKITVFIDNTKVWEIDEGDPLINNATVGFQASAGGNPSSEVWFDNIVVTSVDDGIDLAVPLLKQTNPLWGGFTYDSANEWAPPEPTDIARWGCALTSAAMVFQYHKITKLPNSIDLTPGTLNVWLKNYTPLDPEADGYIRNGLVNWVALERLSREAKDQNPDFSFDALDYVRYGEDHDQLKTDLENNIPGILGVNNDNHFVVAKGVNNEDIFTINDPYDDFEDLSAYSNSFSSLGRFIPSNTDLSYLMLVVNEEVDISVSSSSGELVGESFIQQPLENEETPGDFSGDPLRIFYLPDPSSGNYELALSSGNNNNYDLDVYYYDIDGNVHIDYFSGIVGTGDEDNYSIAFDKNNSDNSFSVHVVTFDSLINDINSLRATGDINNLGVYISLLTKAKVAKGLSGNVWTKKTSINLLKSSQKEIEKQKGKGVSETAFDILKADIEALILQLGG